MKTNTNTVDPLSIVELIHAVPLGSASWKQVLEQVAPATGNRQPAAGSRAATMVIQDRASGELVGFHEHGIPAERTAAVPRFTFDWALLPAAWSPRRLQLRASTTRL